MSLLKAIARRDGKPSFEMLFPVQGNEAIFGRLATRILGLQATLKRERLHTLIAVDYFTAADAIRSQNGVNFLLCESNIDMSGNKHLSLLLVSKCGMSLHWPKLTDADIQAMKQPEVDRCKWCAGPMVESASGPECPVCH